MKHQKAAGLLKSIDIEKLLQWALREELPKGRRVSTEPFQLIRPRHRRGFVPGGPRASVDDGLGFVAGEPHEDAEVVAQAVNGLQPMTFGAAECAALLGDYAGVAAADIRAFAGVPVDATGFVVGCAAQGISMAWQIGAPQPRPRRRYRNGWGVATVTSPDGDGIAAERIANANKRGLYPPGSATALVWQEPSCGVLLKVRADYAAWHRALCVLTESVRGLLINHLALPPSAPAAPWLGDNLKKARILRHYDARDNATVRACVMGGVIA